MLKDYNKPALIWQDQAIDYRTVLDAAGHFSQLLSPAKNERIAIFAENRPEWAYALYAGWLRGYTVVPVDHLATAEEVAYILSDCAPSAVFYSDSTSVTLHQATNQAGLELPQFNISTIPGTTQETTVDSIDITDVHATALIIYTSGTTGSPKGVMLSFDNLLANIESLTEVGIYHSEHRVLLLLPLHHVFPLVGALIAVLFTGGTAVFVPAMTGEAISGTMKKHRVSMVIGVPRLYELIHRGIMSKINAKAVTQKLFGLAHKIDHRGFSKVLFKKVHDAFGGNVQFLVSGGAALDPQIARDMFTLGFDLLEGYGMTESAPMISFTRSGEGIPGSAGRTVPTLEVTTRDGEIVARGRNIMQGYYNRPEETADIIRDGWLHTGDLGHVDEQGRLFITGRRKQIIVLPNGKNVNPEEIEEKLRRIAGEALIDVAVLMHNRVLHALFQLNPALLNGQDPDTFIQTEIIRVYNQQASEYKKIRRFTRIDQDLPRTRLGKLKRFELGDLFAGKVPQKKNEAIPEYAEYRLLSEYLANEKRRVIMPGDNLETDLAMDSLDRVSLQTFIDATFGLNVTEKTLEENESVAKLAGYIRENKTRVNVDSFNWSDILREKINITLPRRWFTQNLIKNTSRWLFRTYFRLRGEGAEKIPQGPVIIAPNHQSFFDGLFVAAFLKNPIMKNTYFYAKEKHVRKGWVRFLADRNNVIVVDINRDLKQSILKLAAVLRSGRNIIIFPEGTRTADGDLGVFKKTFAILARELQVPVVPVAIRGAFEALPRGARFPRPWRKIRVNFLDPVYPADHNYDSLTDEVYRQLLFQVKQVPA
jgi:long-chain acyl-CoA synthetase